MPQEAKRNFLINLLYCLAVFGLIYIISVFLLKYFMPFILGGLIAWAVQKPACMLSDKTHLKRSACAVLTAALLLTTLTVSIGIAVYAVISRAGGLLSELTYLSEKLSYYTDIVYSVIHSFTDKLPEKISSALNSAYDDILQRFLTAVTELASETAGEIAGRIPKFVLSSVVTAVASCYIAADFPVLVRFIGNLCGEKICRIAVRVKEIAVNSIFRLAKGYLFLMLLTFAELFIGLLALRVKHALILAMLISFVDILPVFGTGTVLVPWASSALLLGESRLGIGLLILYTAITLIRNFAEPKIIGEQIGINPLFTLIFMFIGAKLSGFSGMIIFPTVFIIVIKYYKEDI